MRNTIWAPVIAGDGAAFKTEVRQGYWRPEITNHLWVNPIHEVRARQPARIPVNLNHRSDQVLGEVIHLEVGGGPPERLWAVAQIDERIQLGDEPVYFSMESTASKVGSHGRADIEIAGVALCGKSAQIGLSPVKHRQGDLTFRGASKRWNGLTTFERELLEHAEQARFHRRVGDPIVVTRAQYEFDRPAGQLEYRSASTVDVRPRSREIQLVVMPYNEPTIVEHRGRMITEVCSPTAFHGEHRHASRVSVNRDHDQRRLVGKAIALHPQRQEGLVADLKISNTPLGTETLKLAKDGCLDASAGFLVLPNGETWETSSRRRLTRCHLAHVALVPEPAYTGAKVISVRHTPNLDRLRAELALS